MTTYSKKRNNQTMITTCVFLFFIIAFRLMKCTWMHSFLATIQVLKSGASGVPFLKKSQNVYFLEQSARRLAEKIERNKYIKQLSKMRKNKAKSGPCPEISCATQFCIVHATYFQGQTWNTTPGPHESNIVTWESPNGE